MSDLRARLTDALKDSAWPPYATFDQIADVLLSLPGIAIVELPEGDDQYADGPYGEDEIAPSYVAGALNVWNADTGAEIATWPSGCVTNSEGEEFTPQECREYAAALLAAANAAEIA